MTAALPLILKGLLMAISAAPQITELVAKAKEFFGALFASGLITREQQEALFLRIDAHCALVNAGIVEPEFLVEPDPTV
jgi:hypothetical protein